MTTIDRILPCSPKQVTQEACQSSMESNESHSTHHSTKSIPLTSESHTTHHHLVVERLLKVKVK